MSTFRKKYSHDVRLSEANNVLTKYSDRIPIIVEQSSKYNGTNKIDKSKFLVPISFSLGQFSYIIRKRIKLNENEALFLFIDDKYLVQNSESLSQVYEKYKFTDNFLYITYCNENTFGQQK